MKVAGYINDRIFKKNNKMTSFKMKMDNFSNFSDSESSENENFYEKSAKVSVDNIFQTSQVESRDSAKLIKMNRKKSHFMRNLIIFANVLIGQLVLYIIFISLSQNIELFTWHPPLMTIGVSITSKLT